MTTPGPGYTIGEDDSTSDDGTLSQDRGEGGDEEVATYEDRAANEDRTLYKDSGVSEDRVVQKEWQATLKCTVASRKFKDLDTLGNPPGRQGKQQEKAVVTALQRRSRHRGPRI